MITAHCPTCAFENPDIVTKCQVCGSSLPKALGLAARPRFLRNTSHSNAEPLKEQAGPRCTRCNEPNPPLVRRCRHCRADLSTALLEAPSPGTPTQSQNSLRLQRTDDEEQRMTYVVLTSIMLLVSTVVYLVYAVLS